MKSLKAASPNIGGGELGKRRDSSCYCHMKHLCAERELEELQEASKSKVSTRFKCCICFKHRES